MPVFRPHPPGAIGDGNRDEIALPWERGRPRPLFRGRTRFQASAAAPRHSGAWGHARSQKPHVRPGQGLLIHTLGNKRGKGLTVCPSFSYPGYEEQGLRMCASDGALPIGKRRGSSADAESRGGGWRSACRRRKRQAVRRPRRADGAGELPDPSPFLRDPSSGRGMRHSHGAGVARPQRCQDDDNRFVIGRQRHAMAQPDAKRLSSIRLRRTFADAAAPQKPLRR